LVAESPNNTILIMADRETGSYRMIHRMRPLLWMKARYRKKGRGGGRWWLWR